MKLLAVLLFLPFYSIAQCGDIKYSKDKFTDVESWQTPTHFEYGKKQNFGSNVVASGNKIVSPIIMFYTKDTSGYKIMVTLYGEQSSFNVNGLFFVFDNGEKLQYPQKEIGSDHFGNRLAYLAVVKLSPSEVDLFISSRVTDIRIAGNDTQIEPWIGEKMKAQFACLKGKMK